MFIKSEKGISLRIIHIFLITFTVFISGIIIFYTYRLTSNFMSLSNVVEEYMNLEKAAHKLMEASDYLTENVQRFTVDGEREFLDAYFTEAFESNRREEAIKEISVDKNTEKALSELQEAMDYSLLLMKREYYAMRLVVEAKDIKDYPEELDEIKLTPEDSMLSPEDKMRLATEMVLNEDYYIIKDKIRSNMDECLYEIDNLTQKIKTTELASLNKEITIVRVVIIALTVTILLIVTLSTFLGLNPIVRAVDRIKSDSPLPETGAKEFKYLAKAYNKMYAKYKRSFEKLNYKASHDELTGAYNRSGYDLLLDSIDLESTYMMLFDVDNFKNINDTYGHEVGDKVLVKLVSVLKNIFRDDDCVCRIGGDEFVVFMVHSSGMQRRLIESKINQINSQLENTDDGLPPITISVGIVNGKDAPDKEKLFEKSDEAMYKSKKHGKHTYTFYSDK